MVEGAAVPSEEDIKAVREEMKAEKEKNRRGSRGENCDSTSRGATFEGCRNRDNNNNNNNNNNKPNSNSNSNWN